MQMVEILSKLGFNIHLFGSEKYILNKLQSLGEKEIQTIKEAFIKHCHARFTKHFFCHTPFGKKKAYAEEVGKANLEKVTRLIKVCSILTQTKVYLFWKRGWTTSFLTTSTTSLIKRTPNYNSESFLKVLNSYGFP